MAQRHTISGRRTGLVWLSILVGLALIVALVAIVLFVYPNYQRQQQVEQHYQAGVAFQETSDWDKAVEAFERVVAIDATYKDAQTRLTKVRTKQQEVLATVQARATAKAVAQLEATYQKCLGAMNLERWAEAKTACDKVFASGPSFKDVQAKLTEIETKLAELRALTPTSMPPTYTPYPTATPYPTFTPVPTPRPTVTPWKELDKTAIPATFYFGFNTSKAPFGERLVRRAFSCAIDRQTIVDDIDGQREPATTFVPPETLGRTLYGEVGCSYDPNKAREFLSQAGYSNGVGLPRIVLVYSANETSRKIVDAAQKMWLAVLGSNVQLESMEWEAYSILLAENAPQIYLLGWAADYNDPINFLNVFHSGGPNNYANFANPEYDKLVEAAAVETDKPRRMEMFVEAERTLCETEVVIAPVYYYTVKK